ncbi:MAG: RNA-binding transcriptional accessory protein [Phycisphaerae bacterium]|nr:RNA-binding transcriptional accessory protein [Phycisphaerae bacterium]
MNEQHVIRIAQELGVKVMQVSAVAGLLDEGGTVPFIARYRKEATGSLDEVAITAVRDRLDQLKELDKRRESILETIAGQGKLTDELKTKINAAETMTVLEDLYLPYKPKRRTRGTMAKEKGLEPLARLIFDQEGTIDPAVEAAAFINKEKDVETVADALQGARDIMAEWVSEDQAAREAMRKLYWNKGEFVTKVATGKEEAGIKYKDYYDWQEPVAKAPSHRILAMRRGAKEKFLTLRVLVPEEMAIDLLERQFIKTEGAAAEQIRLTIADSFKRLLALSMETEIRLETKKLADEEAIKVFVENLRQLLLSSPMGQKRVMALDPGFRTGCKLVCLDSQGQLLFNDAIYPHNGQHKEPEAGVKVMALCQKYNIEAIAVGNGTAGRETGAFLRKLGLPPEITIIMLRENAASVYSASEVAREEFGQYDLTVRGAVSIGRRLMDPLAELVKIDPKSIGVGQYQHDVDQNHLKVSLDDTVMSCVNNVGVEVNTASKQLLNYVSGVGPNLAERIVGYRNENGPFGSRKDLMKVTGLGAKTFEQCAGFLRIRNGANPLDGSAVHPESYAIVEQMAADVGCTVAELVGNDQSQLNIDLHKYVTETVGLPTLTDIKAELNKPGRDPREKFEAFSFTEGVNAIGDLEVGMQLPGIVTNITAFGAFVDLGVHQDGLVHISQMANKFVSDPASIVKVHQKVIVWVTEVDVPRGRIALSMLNPNAPQNKPRQQQDKPNQPAETRPGDRTTPATNKKRRGGTDAGSFGNRLDIRFGK